MGFVPTKLFTLSERNTIDNILIQCWDQLWLQDEVIKNYNKDDSEFEKVIVIYEEWRIKWGEKAYVLYKIIDTDIPIFRNADRKLYSYIDNSGIIVETNQFNRVLDDIIKWKQGVIDFCIGGVRRITKDMDENTVVNIQARRKTIKRMKKDIFVIQKLKMVFNKEAIICI